MKKYIQKPIVIIAILCSIIAAVIQGMWWQYSFENLSGSFIRGLLTPFQILIISGLLASIYGLFQIRKNQFKQGTLILLPYLMILVSIIMTISTIRLMVFDSQMNSTIETFSK